ncbi:hypothetical protein HanRHA438_Chr14g0642471 [Helianthus annuus]|nr:hypothetical protein HanIR_Chr14g0685271 [Helianthus annuus]KAJ0467442.1 hypothetical protein HanIR_Chr14g0685281 [Helianthus annuus]KAJ0852682.1 hypothetical protein HanRHA438_Chr14g0642471 [Helianthus annuus]
MLAYTQKPYNRKHTESKQKSSPLMLLQRNRSDSILNLKETKSLNLLDNSQLGSLLIVKILLLRALQITQHGSITE